MKSAEWVLIDVETSGHSTGERIIELGLVEMRGWKPVGRGKSWLINHQCDISWRAESIHGISRHILDEHGMPPVKAYREIIRFLDGRPYGAHNLNFESRCIKSDFECYGLSRRPETAICTLKMARMFLGPNSNSLENLATRYKLKNQPQHRALPDARATAELAQRVLSKHVDVNDFDVLCTLSKLPMAQARKLCSVFRL